MSDQSRLASVKARWAAMPPTLRGIIFMSVATVAFSAMHTMVRHVSEEIHPFQIAFFRSFFGLLVFLPMLMRQGLEPFKTKRLPMHVLRGGLNIIAMMGFFYALSIAPIARVTALGFSAPIFTALLSVVVLGEKFRLHRWSAIIFGFVGALIVLRPGIIPLDLGSMLVLMSASLWGTTMIVIKLLSRTDSSITITTYMNLLLAIFALGPAIWVWQTPQLETWGWLLAIGVVGTFAQLGLTQALKEGETTVVLPFDFLRLIWASMLGLWLFSEAIDFWTWVGAAVIIGSGIYVAYREGKINELQGEKP